MHVHGWTTGSVLKWSIGLMLALALAEAVAGYFANSLALLSDAGHNFTDSLALLLAWFAHRLQAKPPTESKTFGYHRAGVLAAFVNALLLVALAGYIFFEAYQRLRAPQPVNPEWMMIVAGFGFLVDAGVSGALLRKMHGDLNLRTAFIHTAADALSTAGIVLGGFLIQRTGRAQIDPLLSVLIGGLILWSSVGVIREALNILLEGLPRGLKLETVIAALLRVPGVQDVHDVHIWSLGSQTRAMSCHTTIADIPPSESHEILQRINRLLEKEFHIGHATIQFEHAVCEVSPGCYAAADSVSQRGRA